MSNVEAAYDHLGDVIVQYASDYEKAEWARQTTWDNVEVAIAAFEQAVRKDQP